MTFVVLPDVQKEQYKNDILEIMYICDNDFVPELLSRNSILHAPGQQTPLI